MANSIKVCIILSSVKILATLIFCFKNIFSIISYLPNCLISKQIINFIRWARQIKLSNPIVTSLVTKGLKTLEAREGTLYVADMLTAIGYNSAGKDMAQIAGDPRVVSQYVNFLQQKLLEELNVIETNLLASISASM